MALWVSGSVSAVLNNHLRCVYLTDRPSVSLWGYVDAHISSEAWNVTGTSTSLGSGEFHTSLRKVARLWGRRLRQTGSGPLRCTPRDLSVSPVPSQTRGCRGPGWAWASALTLCKHALCGGRRSRGHRRAAARGAAGGRGRTAGLVPVSRSPAAQSSRGLCGRGRAPGGTVRSNPA